ncbi:MAG: helix-turn-helix transcriptional regulator [Selenomonas sp.]|uniref:helix-turn-helix domain-containing protein n=1 Tax=Selenomonas sp. TaxID=2053611 RepID=UPI0025F512C3|nr:helix-turn-helix transcriptional regulator [Selenomonas sp.]MCR5440298.1 helix-turn-helix transcriptional regulator [Selenomonas sp.]
MSGFNLDYIARRRKELKLSTEDMAKLLGYSNGSVYWKYEHGVYKFNADKLPLLASALKCRISHFYTLKLAKTES